LKITEEDLKKLGAMFIIVIIITEGFEELKRILNEVKNVKRKNIRNKKKKQ